MDLKNKQHKFTLFNGLLSMDKGQVYSMLSTQKHGIIDNHKSLNKKREKISLQYLKCPYHYLGEVQLILKE